MSQAGVGVGELLLLFCIVSIRGDWTPWSSCSKSCDVGVQIRSKSDGGEIIKEEQFCNLEYCPGIGKFCSGGCYKFEGRAACINNECICSMGRYYNKYNCYPEVGNCTIRESPPFSLVHVDADSLKYGYKLRGCVTNDNPENEVHMIGIYGDSYSTYRVVIRPRGESKKPIILVLSSYHVTHWKIDTTVHLDTIIYGSLKENSNVPIEILEKSKCGSSNIIQWRDIASSYGSDTGGGNTVRALLDVARYYGPVTSFTGVYKLYWPARFTLEVGGNPLQNRHSNDLEYVNTKECTKVSEKYSNMTTTVSSVSATENGASSSKTNALIPVLAVSFTLVFLLVCFFCYWKMKRKRNNHSASSQTNVMYQARFLSNDDTANRNRTSQFIYQERVSNPDILANIPSSQIHDSYPTPTSPSFPGIFINGQSFDNPPPPYSTLGLGSRQSGTEAPPTVPHSSVFNSNNSGNSLHPTSDTTDPTAAASAPPEHATFPTSTSQDLPPSYSSCVDNDSDLPPSYESL